eukprot:2786785-Rhodomonas_salina.1
MSTILIFELADVQIIIVRVGKVFRLEWLYHQSEIAPLLREQPKIWMFTVHFIMQEVWGKEWSTNPRLLQEASETAVYKHLRTHNTMSETAVFTCRRMGFGQYVTTLR